MSLLWVIVNCFLVKSLLSRTVFCGLIFHHSVLASLLRPFIGLLPGVLIVDCFGSPAVDPVSFLPDEAEVACRAILPQCFRRSDWADLCAREPSVAVGHP